MRIGIAALTTLPEVAPGDDVARLIREAAAREGEPIDAGTLVAVAQKIVSKAEGAVVDLRAVTPSAFARQRAEEWRRDARLIEVILRESRRIVKMDRGVIIAETRHGFVCANAGVDQSNSGGGELATVLPVDPDASAEGIRSALGCGAVIVTDTFGRPWREGLVDVAIGVAGLEAIEDCRGRVDRHRRILASTVVAIADQAAAAAGLVMRKADGCPVALLRGVEWRAGRGSGRDLVRPPDRDLFR
ncbi:MAG: coenzyme F420-0:L-glutamate ligase [Bryobacteraceae bacterium]|nr:coenzyme F420-0:L-glutamate ligase [Bryobacteraceae bacterium]